MKKYFQLLFIVFTLVIISPNINAQITTNNWIEYDKTHYKFYIEEDGLFRIDYETLQNSGIPLIGSHFKLINKGEEIPIYVSTSSTFGENDYIEFIGKKNDGTFDTQLFKEPEWQITDQYSLFTDKNAYFLVSDEDANHIKYNETTNDLSISLAKVEYFEHTIEQVYPETYTPGLAPRLVGGVNNHFADFNPSEGYASIDVNGGDSKNFTINTHDVYDTGGNATIECKVLGKNDDVFAIPDHHIEFSVNNYALIDTAYEGYNQVLKYRSVPLSILQNENAFVLSSIGDKFSELSPNQSPAIDKNAIGYVNITYQRGFDFNNERAFGFEIPNNAAVALEIENFNGGASPIIYDVTNRLRLVPVFEDNLYKVNLPAPNFAGEKRELFIVNSTSVLSINEVTDINPVTFVDYTQTAGDYLILYNEVLTESVDGLNQIQRYKEYRESVAGGEYDVVLVEVNDLYDQFAYGIVHHPMSINNFVNYTIQLYNEGIWNIEPAFLYMIGKGIRYSKTRQDATGFAQNLVPTFGSGGDIMLATDDIINNYVPQLAVGRFPARNATDVKSYLDKVIEHENLPNSVGCDVEELRKMRDVVLLAGGKSGIEAVNFTDDLIEYKAHLESRTMGALTYDEFIKQESGIVDIPELHPLIDDGLMLIDFVGHSAGTLWEFDINKPSEYTNYGKYPFIISNSCFVGDVFQPQQTEEIMSIEWTAEEGLGAIGFLATVRFGFPTFLHTFTDRLHELFCEERYLTEIGKCTQQVISDIYLPNDTNTEGVGRKITCQEFTLLSDPAIRIGYFDKPIMYLEESGISISPSVIDTAVDSFEVKIALNNFGAATNDSTNLIIERIYPDGTNKVLVDDKILVPAHQDTVAYYVQTEPLDGLGSNSLKIYLNDAANFDAVSCFQDTEVKTSFFVVPNAATPVSPCDYAIVGDIPTLNASTSLAFWELGSTYLMQIDSVGNYENIIADTTINSIGGVISWQPPVSVFQDGTEYFWRVAQQPETGEQPQWRTSSFIYLEGSAGGWNQSDYYQFNENKFDNLRLDETNQQFDYSGVENLIAVNNTWSPANNSSYLNNNALAVNSCLYNCGNGVMVAAFKPSLLLEPIKSEKSNNESGCSGIGQWGNIFCSSSSADQDIFGFYTGDADKITQFNTFLNTVPNGYYILAYSIRNHRFEADSDMATEMTNVVDFFVEDLGLDGLETIGNNEPFIVFGKKGEPNFSNKQQVYGNPQESIFLDVNVTGKENFGSMTSQLVGPSAEWDKLLWEGYSLDNIEDRDEYNVNILLRDTQGQMTYWGSADGTENEFSVDLSAIDAQQFPYIELVYETTDTLNYSAPQMNYWRVLHQKYVELSLNPASNLTFDSDTLAEGQAGTLHLDISNVMPFASDSLEVLFTVTDMSANTIVSQETVMYPAIAGGSVFDMVYDAPTEGLSGDASLFIQINPASAQNEKFSFNNQISIPFYVISDKANPIVDVTFDGEHILDGDIISTNPVIDIELKDENTFLAMNDTSLLQMSLISPSGEVRVINYNDLDVAFTPATAQDAIEKNNVFSVQLSPEFLTDGTYQLVLNGKDISNNETANIDYSISFQIISEATISHVLNYPNPFTTSTRFVFNLTGTEVPNDLRIQIMTVSGKIVKEITLAELGDIRIGRNITEYAWNGTDKYGNELANGVYFYRVVASQNGEELGLFSQTEANANVSSTKKLDDMFGEAKIGEKYKDFGIGKMYKLK